MAKTSMMEQTFTYERYKAYWKEGGLGWKKQKQWARWKQSQKQMGKMALQIGADGSADEQRLAAAEVELQSQPKPQPELEPQPEFSSLCSCPCHSHSLALRTWCAAGTCLYGTPIEP